jgi:hypothetical protein
MIWFPNFNLGRLIYFLLLVELDSSPDLRARSVQVRSRGVFTIVIWPERLATPSCHLGNQHMNTVWHSTWWSRLWKLWQMSATPGSSGEAAGAEEMLSISNFLERPNGPHRKDPQPNKNL